MSSDSFAPPKLRLASAATLSQSSRPSGQRVDAVPLGPEAWLQLAPHLEAAAGITYWSGRFRICRRGKAGRREQLVFRQQAGRQAGSTERTSYAGRGASAPADVARQAQDGRVQHGALRSATGHTGGTPMPPQQQQQPLPQSWAYSQIPTHSPTLLHTAHPTTAHLLLPELADERKAQGDGDVGAQEVGLGAHVGHDL